MLEEHLALPFETTMLGVVVNVARLDVRGDNDIVAICTRGRERQSIPILDLPLPRSRPVRTEWIEALRDRFEVDESRYGTLMLEYREGIVSSDRPAD